MAVCGSDVFIPEHIPGKNQSIQHTNLSFYKYTAFQYFVFEIRPDLCILSDQRIDHADSRQNISGILRVLTAEFNIHVQFFRPEKAEKSFKFTQHTKKGLPVCFTFNKRFQTVLFLFQRFYFIT